MSGCSQVLARLPGSETAAEKGREFPAASLGKLLSKATC